jgi:hypothetical protein
LASVLHVEGFGCSPDDAGKSSGRPRQSFIVALIIAGQHEQLQAAGLGDRGGGDAIAAQGLDNGGDGLRGVGDPVGLVRAGRLDCDG